MFVAIEGPNGVGKTTVAELLASRWRSQGDRPVHLTAEPSALPLGAWLRQAEDWLDGRPLAMVLAADRYMHIDQEIIPTLDAGAHVLSDQYVQSSLVLQRVDGMDLDEVWTYNCYVLPPSLTVYLDDDPDTLAERVILRGRTTRIEQTTTAEQEIALFAEAIQWLERESWRQRTVDCRGRTPDDVVDAVLAHIAEVP